MGTGSLLVLLVAFIAIDVINIETTQKSVHFRAIANVLIHIGEFSAICWTLGKSTCNYLNDIIELFEENVWNWDYHAFREWQGWDVEMIGDKDHPQHSPVPTDRQLRLMNISTN